MKRVLNLTVLVAALGYFVDLFDLTIFGVVRIASLKEILPLATADEILRQSVYINNMQAAGMLIGGLFWGVLGDRRGRLSVLFGSIILYSLANFGNAYVTTIPMYAAMRFLAGLGLAGELGAAITLVSESLEPDVRGIGTTVVASLGMLGVVAASLTAQFLDWKSAYLVGGSLGLVLLFARFGVVDSTVFNRARTTLHRGDLGLLLTGSRLKRYVFCIFAGIPMYLTTGILLTLAPELARDLGLSDITVAKAVLCGSVGLTIGDVFCGLLSQFLKSRKLAIYVALLIGLVGVLMYLKGFAATSETFYLVCFVLGLAGGYWSVLVTFVAEQFGTNLRATAATSIPNFVRATVIPLNFIFLFLHDKIGSISSALLIASVVYALAIAAVYALSETFGKDLGFNE